MKTLYRLLNLIITISILYAGLTSCKASAATNKHELNKEIKHMERSKH